MPIATLLLRENSALSLSQAVEKALLRRPPLLEYDLQLTTCQLDLVLLSKPERSSSLDEGFESDMDSVSLVSTDENFTPPVPITSKNLETDSANGSACSDSDDTDSTTTVNTIQSKYSTLKRDGTLKNNETSKAVPEGTTPTTNVDNTKRESLNLVDCICYTDVKAHDLLLFVIKSEVLVFRLSKQTELQKFYGAFTALKAVSNQKTYNANNTNTIKPTKFNLLHRTDSNGVTHIEISREPTINIVETASKSNIISINTPESNINNDSLLNKTLSQKSRDDILLAKSANKKSMNDYRSNTIGKFNSLYINKERSNAISRQREHPTLKKSASIDNILLDVCEETATPTVLEKVWNSVEDLLSLDAPKKPERKKKTLKGPAPQPPARTFKENVLKGSYVRVNVPKFEPKLILTSSVERPVVSKPNEKVFDHKATILRASLPEKKESNLSKLQSFAKNTLLPSTNRTKLTTYQQFKYSEPKKLSDSVSTLTRSGKSEHSWVNSVKMSKKHPRSRSETRNFTPMAYRYIDTTQSSYVLKNAPTSSNFQLVNPAASTYQNQVYIPAATGSNIGTFQKNKNAGLKVDVTNRLFGMSSKLRDFSSGTLQRSEPDGRYSSLGDLSYRFLSNANNDTNLKSVIKKDDGKKRNNEKKVTFSAYTTVQVV